MTASGLTDLANVFASNGRQQIDGQESDSRVTWPPSISFSATASIQFGNGSYRPALTLTLKLATNAMLQS